jgi:hypothetical protein
MNETAGEGETNLRGFDTWPVTVTASTEIGAVQCH